MTPATLCEGLQRCPAHQDRRPSLSVRRATDGKVLVHCYAGCRTEDILRAWGLGWDALFSDDPKRPQTSQPKPKYFLDAARQEMLRRWRRQAWNRPGVLRAYHEADLGRRCDRLAQTARQVATRIGPGSLAWNLLDAAAALERLAA